MKYAFLLVGLWCCLSVSAQYQFMGEVPLNGETQSVYLSLVEDYRKSSRTYYSQIIKETKTDSLGHFKFEGDNLSSENRIYRIHIDGCTNEDREMGHFLKSCHNSESVLFIANNNDSISFPLIQSGQPLCDIQSSNQSSDLLLQIKALKEEMILDFMEYPSKANESLNFRKWFNVLQEYGEKSGEPLAELYVYEFLSDRRNETHAHYLDDVKSNTYYDGLLSRLKDSYQNAPFTSQYESELRADQTRNKRDPEKASGFQLMHVLYIGLLLLFSYMVYSTFKKQKRKKAKGPLDSLTVQERNIAAKIGEGKSNKEIASELFVSLSTVKTHINNIYKKLGVTSREDIKSMLGQ